MVVNNTVNQPRTIKIPMKKDDLNEIGNQLSCPKGDNGIEMGNTMNKSNNEMILNSIDQLNIKNGNSILEIGHGNCRHLSEILNKATDIKYSGIEASEIMVQEAERINKSLTSQKEIVFKTYNGKEIPFENNYFDRILTINTIYFFENTVSFFNEINRVLKDNGILIITYVQKSLMEKLPFITTEFKLFDNEDIKEIANKTKFIISEFKSKTEFVRSKDGKIIERLYSIAVLKKAVANKVYKT